MKNHDPHIESLLEQFMQGETSLEQEQELSNFFANSTSTPKQWEAYREMFAYFDRGMPIDEEKPKHNITRPIWALVTAAAIAAIVIMVVPHLHRPSTIIKTTMSQPTIVNNDNKTFPDTIVKPKQPQAAQLLTKEELKSIKKKVRGSKHYSPIDSIEIEREKGEVEQAQQELMADKYLIEQERQEILNEQYNSRAQTFQAQQSWQNDNPQIIQVVFK